MSAARGQRASTTDAVAADSDHAPPEVAVALRESGRPLPAGVATALGQRLGADFDGVRVHTGPVAARATAAVSALAFTVGRDVVFAPGRFRPQHADGQRLLTHELTHVVQQGAAPVAPGSPVAERSPARVARQPADPDALMEPEDDPELVARIAAAGAETRRRRQQMLDALARFDSTGFSSVLNNLDEAQRIGLEMDQDFLDQVRRQLHGRNFWTVVLRLRYGAELPSPARALKLAVSAGEWAEVGRLLRTHRDLRDGTIPGVREMIAAETAGVANAQELINLASEACPAALDGKRTQIAHEEMAVRSRDLLVETHRKMFDDDHRIVANTARLLGPKPDAGGPPATGGRLAYTPLTIRHDTSLLSCQNNSAAGYSWFFRGVLVDNQQEEPNSIGGTIAGDTLLVRAAVRGEKGLVYRDYEELASTIVHESSHILVASYGEHPNTSDAASFDRYRDEFRAYWSEPYRAFSKIPDLGERAKAIRRTLVGDSATDTNTIYPDLRDAYWNPPPPQPNQFRSDVDGHWGPEGFNQEHDPELDRLFQITTPGAAGDGVLAHVVGQMSPADRAAASASPLIQGRVAALDADAPGRVSTALGFPQTDAHATLLNPGASARVSAVLVAIAQRDATAIVAGYRRLDRAERTSLHLNPAALVFTRRQIPDPRQRIAVMAMLNTGRSDQYAAMDAFVAACQAAAAAHDTAPTADLRTARAALDYTAGLSLMGEADARAAFIEVLDQPLGRQVRDSLLDEAPL